MTGAETIALYERILAIMERMRDAAHRADWDRLIALEHECKAVVAQLAGLQPEAPLTADMQRRKARVIRQVLVLDAAIRDVTEPRLKQLQAFLGSRRTEKKLRHTYGAPDGA